MYVVWRFMLPEAGKEISNFHVESAYQHADFLTEALHVGDFEFHRNFVMSVGQER
ncbi:unnamed protein product [Ectocarpus sp. CCAP 1310/34]|nr:unnamed protein product [Ectocarpus sp. CCAP 1310/34]